MIPFTGAPMTPEAAAQAREAVAAERGDDAFDVCVWGSADLSGAFDAAGVTWLMQSARPEDSLDSVRGIIDRGATPIGDLPTLSIRDVG